MAGAKIEAGRMSFGAGALIVLAIIAAVVLASGLLVPSAFAGQEISELSVGSSNSQAGGHPDLTARIELAKSGEPEVANNVTVNLPTGVFGNPGAIFRCRAAVFVVNECQAGAQAGLVTIVANYEGDPNYLLGTAPVYNMETVSENEAARLAFVVPVVDIPVVVPVQVRSESDYGLQLSIHSISQTLALTSASLTIWGFPAAKSHNAERFLPGEPGAPPGCPNSLAANCLEAPFQGPGEFVRPFTDNPSVCTGAALPVTVAVTTYQDPNPTVASASYPKTEGCESQRFDPDFRLGLTTAETDAPSGLDIQLKADQFLSGEAPSPSTLRSATLTLPEGLSINPDAADGQSSCSDAQAGFGTTAPGACPDSSKIGTVEVVTPALEHPLEGSLYIGEPEPGHQYRVFMIFDGLGLHAKLRAEVEPNPLTGQVTMTVADIPQVPFEEFNLHLFASDRGLMATPTRCTVYGSSARLVPWNGALASQESKPFVSISTGPHGGACPGQLRPFNPTLVAGTANPRAGAFSPFSLQLNREDGDQYLGKLNFKLPPGFTGDLRGITYCSEASIAAAAARLGREEQAHPSCPASSEIGTSNVAAGPGGHPFHAVGKMYLAGPFQGAPLSLVAITPALAGPYDYGTVVIRVALHVDSKTAQVTADSETVPEIIGGVPIRMRTIQVNINKPNFTLNPTNCSPFSVDSEGIGDQGTVAKFSSYFQAVNCSTLPFKPRMTISQLGGHKQTNRSKDPSVRFDLYTRGGDANLKSVAVTLPKAFAIDQRHLGNICSKAELAATRCAGRAALGTVSVDTPLLEKPLTGTAYAVSGYGKLPHLAFILGGQVTLIPEAESSSVKGGHLKTVVPVVPDAPIGHFRLTLSGGKLGYLTNTRALCASSAVTTVEYTAQNGKKLTQRVKAKTACGSSSKQKRKHQKR